MGGDALAGPGHGDGRERAVLLVALSCGRVRGMLERGARHPFLVFGTMERDVLARVAGGASEGLGSEGRVYFYETG